MGTTPILFVSDIDLVRQVFIKNISKIVFKILLDKYQTIFQIRNP